MNQGFRMWRAGHIYKTKKYYAIWNKGTGEAYWLVGVLHDEFKSFDKTVFDKGFRLVDYNWSYIDWLDGPRLFSGVWRPGSGAQYWTNGYSEVANDGYVAKGLRLERIWALWRPGSGEQRIRFGLSLDEFKAYNDTQMSKGLRLVDIAAANTSFSGLWRPGTGEEWFHVNVGFDEFKALNEQYSSKGLTLIQMDAHNLQLEYINIFSFI